jgi:hypothetical protein
MSIEPKNIENFELRENQVKTHNITYVQAGVS